METAPRRELATSPATENRANTSVDGPFEPFGATSLRYKGAITIENPAKEIELYINYISIFFLCTAKHKSFCTPSLKARDRERAPNRR